jgi:2-dehydro-3-deoxygluconokinase
MPKVVTFGEIMLRLAPPGYLRFSQATSFDAIYGGAEANVSVSLANYGLQASFITRVPNNPIGEASLATLKAFGVDTSHVAIGGDRLGIYFCEKGASVRPSKVVYDRSHSSISTAKPGDIDWEAALDGADWFHWTGITPALSDDTAALVLEACEAAKRKGVKISCDLNYRKNLWSKQKAGEVMGKLVPFVNVLIANEEDASDVFGIKATDTDIDSGKLNVEGYRSVASQLSERFGCELVAITLRESYSASDNGWSGLVYEAAAKEIYVSRKYNLRIVDRVGGGDSFGSGLIYALLNGYAPQAAVEFAAAASALKHTIEGDFNRVSVSEVLSLAGGNASGRVQR